ncbi:MAG: hypothetical protein ABI887_10290 [Burkholderiales bacterium]
MDLEQLTGRYIRLKQELATAYGAVPWNSGRIDRLARDLASTECEIAARIHAQHRSPVDSRLVA